MNTSIQDKYKLHLFYDSEVDKQPDQQGQMTRVFKANKSGKNIRFANRQLFDLILVMFVSGMKYYKHDNLFIKELTMKRITARPTWQIYNI